MGLISKKVGDPRILEIISKFLNVGFIYPSGNLMRPSIVTPQGGILSRLLYNIVLHQFELFMENTIKKYRKGEKRKGSSAYRKLEYLIRKSSVPSIRRDLLLKMRTINSNDRLDPNFKRLDYIKYADDFCILVIGSVPEANHIKNNAKEFLRKASGF